ncbi:MAG: Gfo/Idh/MocA family oxidoreductase [Isosphaeraceae bacterium]
MTDPSRRSFFRMTSGVVAASALATRPASSASPGPSDTVTLAMMGVRGRAGDLMRGFASTPGARIKTLIDVDSRLLPKAVEEVASRQGSTPTTVFGDFRRVLDDKEIDALVVGTPDHWHAIATVLACQAGKDVYVEKPDAHNIREGRLMVAAARKYNRVVQMGVQSRSGAHLAEAVDYLKTGAIGRALYARAWESARQGSIGKPADAPVPTGVDYDTWLGPAAEAAVQPGAVPRPLPPVPRLRHRRPRQRRRAPARLRPPGRRGGPRSPLGCPRWPRRRAAKPLLRRPPGIPRHPVRHPRLPRRKGLDPLRDAGLGPVPPRRRARRGRGLRRQGVRRDRELPLARVRPGGEGRREGGQLEHRPRQRTRSTSSNACAADAGRTATSRPATPRA